LPEYLKGKSWEKAQSFMEIMLFELKNEGFFNETFLKNADAITTGFDDGGLKRIK
jgi:hypothetical protein